MQGHKAPRLCSSWHHAALTSVEMTIPLPRDIEPNSISGLSGQSFVCSMTTETGVSLVTMALDAASMCSTDVGWQQQHLLQQQMQQAKHCDLNYLKCCLN